jgi:hypothetical protein
MKKITTKRKIAIIVYAVAILMQTLFFVPYNTIETRITKQNVPHEYILRSGYDTISNIITASKKEKDYTRRAEVNYKQLVIQLFATTLVGGVVWIVLEEK